MREDNWRPPQIADIPFWDVDGAFRTETPALAALYGWRGRVDCTTTACQLVVHENYNVKIAETSIIATEIEHEVLKEERVEDVIATVTLVDIERITVAVSLTSAFGPFEFTLNVSDARVALAALAA